MAGKPAPKAGTGKGKLPFPGAARPFGSKSVPVKGRKAVPGKSTPAKGK